MDRRTFVGVLGGGVLASTAGCLNSITGSDGEADAEFELVETEVATEAPPEVFLDDGKIIVRGTVEYGSTDCATVELAHAEYEDSQRRLDVLVVSADDPELLEDCNDDLGRAGYRVEVDVDELPVHVVATEHHGARGEPYSTSEYLE